MRSEVLIASCALVLIRLAGCTRPPQWSQSVTAVKSSAAPARLQKTKGPEAVGVNLYSDARQKLLFDLENKANAAIVDVRVTCFARDFGAPLPRVSRPRSAIAASKMSPASYKKGSLSCVHINAARSANDVYIVVRYSDVSGRQHSSDFEFRRFPPERNWRSADVLRAWRQCCYMGYTGE